MKDVISKKWTLAAVGMVALYGGIAMAGSVVNTDSFTANTAATAASVNSKFSGFGTAINDNDTRITALEQGDTDGLTIDELKGTYGAVFLETGELIKGGTDKSGTYPLTGGDNYFMSILSSGSLRFTFDNTGTATLHAIRQVEFDNAHYVGDDGTATFLLDSSRTKAVSECDMTFTGNSASTLELCNTADPTATDTSSGATDSVLSFQIIDSASRAIGMDQIDTTTGDSLKVRGIVSMDGNVIALRIVNSWCGTGYSAGSCTGGKYVGRGLVTLVKIAN